MKWAKRLFKTLFNVTVAVSVVIILALAPIGPLDQAKNRLGIWAYQEGHYDAAYAVFLLLDSYGYGPAQNNLGVLQNLGLGTKQRFHEAFLRYEKAAEAGVAAAKYNLGRLYQRGVGAPWDVERARSLFEEAAAEGDPFALMMIASFAGIERKPGWEQRVEEAYRRAAQAGLAEAQFGLGLFYYDRQAKSAPDRRVLEWWHNAAKRDHAGAQTGLSRLFDGDDAAVLHWRRLAANNGDPAAQFELGQMYERGTGLKQDLAQAAHWYRRAAFSEIRRGNPPAREDLLYAYRHPDVRPPLHNALQKATTALADLHVAGRGVPQDSMEAFQLYRRAASMGWGEAAMKLAELFIAGQGVERDLEFAARWLRIAVDLGHDKAKSRLQAIEAQRRSEPQTGKPDA